MVSEILRRRAAIVAVGLLVAMCGFQLALALGAPLAQFAWGGQLPAGPLPTPYRWMSLAAVPILAAAGWIVLARADLAPPGSQPRVIRLGAWFFTAYLSLNTLGNLASQSAVERLYMTPASLTLALCFAAVASSRPKPP